MINGIKAKQGVLSRMCTLAEVGRGGVTVRCRPRGREELVSFDSRLWGGKVDLVEISFMRSL